MTGRAVILSELEGSRDVAVGLFDYVRNDFA
jgi:hypothetical protein